ncbi:MAG: hypothetical protein [Caudoviricetes sp.]|nr:MAG: hypothetical protein [Caudoviricetes sp.]
MKLRRKEKINTSMKITVILNDEKWIDIRRKLPRDEEIVYFKCKYMDIEYITIGYLYKGNRGHSFWTDNDTFFRSAILAWMPMDETLEVIAFKE